MVLKINPARFLKAVEPDPPPQTMRMATVLASSPLSIQFDGELVDYPDAVIAVPGPLSAGTRVIVTRIALRWVITNIIDPSDIGTYQWAYRTSTLSIGTAKTTYATIAGVQPGVYHFAAALGINNTAGNSCSWEIDFNGTATAHYANWLLNASGAGTIGQTIGITALNSTFGSSTLVHMQSMFDGTIEVTVAGDLSIAATCASSAKTADGGGYIWIQKWG